MIKKKIGAEAPFALEIAVEYGRFIEHVHPTFPRQFLSVSRHSLRLSRLILIVTDFIAERTVGTVTVAEQAHSELR